MNQMVQQNEAAQKLERFSSQGQEELVQAYQLPTVYNSNDGKLSQVYNSRGKRSYTTYGGFRQKSIGVGSYKSRDPKAGGSEYGSGTGGYRYNGKQAK